MKRKTLFIIVILLLVVTAGEIAYLFVSGTSYKGDKVPSAQLSPTISQSTVTSTPSQNRAFSQYALDLLKQVNKSDLIESSMEYKLEGMITAIEADGRVRDATTGDIFEYDYHIALQDSNKSYPENHFYITPAMRPLIKVVKSNPESNEEDITDFDELVAGDKVRFEIVLDLTENWTNSMKSYRIVKL